MNQKKAYEKKMQAQLDEWTAEIDRLKASANKADADARITLNEEVEKMKAKKKAANEKLSELKNASDDAWEDLKNGMEGAWSSLGTAVQAAKSRFA